MDLFVATDHRFWQYENTFYSSTISGYSFWSRYLDVFDKVYVIGRTQKIENEPESPLVANGEGVEIIPLPYYIGLAEGFLKLPKTQAQISQLAQREGAFLLRLPSATGTFFYRYLRQRKRPFAVEVVGDPFDSLSYQAIKKVWSPFLSNYAAYLLKQQTTNSTCAAYVTEKTLQKRYPPPEFNTHYSSLELTEETFDLVGQLRANNPPHTKPEPTRLIFVGSLAQKYKGLHVLFEALKICFSKGYSCSLDILGDGKYRVEYEDMAKQLGIEKHVTFHGHLPQGNAVFEQMCRADIFVMPSLMEGLPRAMIEAMACSLVCIGTRIGGIPELLPSEFIVQPNDVQMLAQKIQQCIDRRDEHVQIGQANRQKASSYLSSSLRQRRIEMYSYLFQESQPVNETNSKTKAFS